MKRAAGGGGPYISEEVTAIAQNNREGGRR